MGEMLAVAMQQSRMQEGYFFADIDKQDLGSSNDEVDEDIESDEEDNMYFGGDGETTIPVDIEEWSVIDKIGQHVRDPNE